MALTEYLKAIISTLEDRIRRSNGGIKNYGWLKETLSELFGWNRRLSEYCEHTEVALVGLRILRSEIDTVDYHWSYGDEDFRYVNRRMLDLKNRIYELISFANGLIGLVEAQQSLEAINASLESSKASEKTAAASLEAAKASAAATTASLAEGQAVTRLTFLGIMFLPLGVTPGLFSMGRGYGPFEPHFWVFWVVAIAVVCLAIIIYVALGLRSVRKLIRIGTAIF
jgi:hypothetical protein